MRSRVATSKVSAEHYVWGGACDGWHLLKDRSLSVIQERVPAGLGEVRHFHTYARQFFYVLKGVGTLEFDDGAVTLQSGEGIEIPPGVLHRFVNKAGSDVEFLVISSPTTSTDRTNVGTTQKREERLLDPDKGPPSEGK